MPTALLVDSTVGRLLDNVCVALRAMTVAGGSHWDVRADAVQTDPINILGVAKERRPTFLVEVSPTGSRTFEPASALTETVKILITMIAEADGDSPDRKTATGLALAMDVEKALTVDIRRGGLSSDTRVLVPEILTALGTDNTVVVVQEVECRVIGTMGPRNGALGDLWTRQAPRRGQGGGGWLTRDRA